MYWIFSTTLITPLNLLLLPLRVMLNSHAAANAVIILLLLKPVSSWRSSHYNKQHNVYHLQRQHATLHRPTRLFAVNKSNHVEGKEREVSILNDEGKTIRNGGKSAVQWPYSLELLDDSVPLVPQIQYPFHYEENEERHERLKMLIMVDVFSPYHGNYLSSRARSVYGCAICNVLSSYLCGYLVQQSQSSSTSDGDDSTRDEEQQTQERIQYLEARIPCSKEEAYAWLRKLPPFVDVVGIHCESDSGLEDSEKLGDWIRSFQQQKQGSSSDTDYNYYNTYNPARRDKFQMIQQVRDYSSKFSNNSTTTFTMKQCLCSSLEDAIDFFHQVQGSVVLKPTRGVASDGVHLCHSKEELIEAFQKVHCSPVFGSLFQTNEAVLVQQYIGGIEYAVDVVSKKGQHKVAAVYQYDKRPTNGGPFVYFATKLADLSEDKKAKMAADYVIQQVLPALDFQWGLTHTEVKVLPQHLTTSSTSNSYCQLIEVNCRQHNTDFAPMTDICIGYNALDMLLAAYLDFPLTTTIFNANEEEEELPPLLWDSVPTYPTLRLRGYIVHLVCHVCGEIQDIQYTDVIQELPSFATMEIYPKFLPSSYVTPTVDIRSDAGWIHLINDDPIQLQSDYDTIVNLMPTMFTVVLDIRR